ncbi:MAG TPA: peptidase S8 [Thermoflexia bacterium]|nr:peptidase S8 [Thermoflexia bacterium]
MNRVKLLSAALLLLFGAISLSQVPGVVISQPPEPGIQVAPPLRAPDNYSFTPLDQAALPMVRSQGGGLKAVVIVGDVGSSTQTYKNDMDVAVTALQNHGVAVSKFYYGESTFSWSDIVAAATDANFLLYMGHGIWWGGPCTEPDLVGGFCLGSEFVSPDQVRSDLAGRLAEDAVIIFSHACFTAGNSGCDDTGSGWPSQAEAERRVKMYAEPFVDIGMEAYFANNYFNSAADYVNQLLAEPATRKNVGDIFKSVYPYSSGDFRDLSYPQAGYDLWLSGNAGDWSDAFVGIPDYTFAVDAQPELGDLTGTRTFTYQATDGQLTPPTYTVTPLNVGNDETLTWSLETAGEWFTVTQPSGSTPDSFSIVPVTATLATLPAGSYSGAVTVTVTAPADTVNAEQRIALALTVQRPTLAQLPSSLDFTYYLSDTVLIPTQRQITPQNSGSDDALTWAVVYTGTWFSVTPLGGTTPAAFTIEPTVFSTTEELTYTGALTVTVTAPPETDNSPQQVAVTLRVVAAEKPKVFLPLILRNYTPPILPRTPNDTYYNDQWAMDKINAPVAWGHSQGDGILIAVLDTGADFGHADLAGKLRSDIDYDYINNDTTAQDDNKHGTHVAGIAAATTDNARGVAGLGWNATVLPLKVLNAAGSGGTDDLVSAIIYAADHGAKIVSMSLSTDPDQDLDCVSDTPSLASAIEYAYTRGVLVVTAAGNAYGNADKVIPANCPHVLTIGATTSSDRRASFSNTGNVIDLAAPGSSILSTYWPGGGYDYLDGTSMATPYVSGLAALVWAAHPTYTPDQVAAALLDNAVDLGGAGWDAEFGCGRIDAAGSVITGTQGNSSTCKPNALSSVDVAHAVPATEPPAEGSYLPGRLIVKWRASPPLLAESVLTLECESTDGAWLVQVPAGREWELLQQLRDDEAVEYVQLDYLLHAQ